MRLTFLGRTFGVFTRRTAAGRLTRACSGEEVLIGKGLVDFRAVFTKLHRIGYTGAVTIERETSGPQQIEDVRNEKIYLEKIVREVVG